MLDPDYINRAAPPGSMRYFALQYAPPERRNTLAALFVVDSEIAHSAFAAHEVAHTRLQWWRHEIDRLTNRNAQHPATQALQAALPNADFAPLHELLVAADMDLAGMTYHTQTELNSYLERSGSTVSFYAQDLSKEMQSLALDLGAAIRRIETIRDLAAHAKAGRIYWPLEDLDARHIGIDALRHATITDAAHELIKTESELVAARLTQTLSQCTMVLRPIAVLGQLHLQLLKKIADAGYDVFMQRPELGGIEKVWTAWRAARRS
ncbi:MAG TPA: squalene/phytoene synthase family protein [Steroidobacteraceae bacterium]|nr:squalene/phytoene synthase family protein [Steroidobacteraceae bacterium]